MIERREIQCRLCHKIIPSGRWRYDRFHDGEQICFDCQEEHDLLDDIWSIDIGETDLSVLVENINQLAAAVNILVKHHNRKSLRKINSKVTHKKEDDN